MLPIKIEITHKTILFTFGALVLGWFLIEIKEIILLLFLSFILMSGLRPMVEKLEKLRIPRAMAILTIYFILIFLLVILGGATLPQMILQTVHFWDRLPEIINKTIPILPFELNLITDQIAPISGNLLQLTIGFFSNVFNLLTLFIMTFYLLLERKNLEETFKSIFGEKDGEKIIRIIWKIEEKLGAWVRGQMVLMFIIGLLIFIGLSLLKVDYALPLAITAGLLEIVPMVGSIISAIPAILVALTVSPALVLAVIALYFVVNQGEGSFIVPVVMKKAIGLSPIVILIALMVGAKLSGIAGALLAIPAVVVLQVIVTELSSEKK